MIVDVVITPGSKGLAVLAESIVGKDRVEGGDSYPNPVLLRGLTKPEADDAIHSLQVMEAQFSDGPSALTFKTVSSSIH